MGRVECRPSTDSAAARETPNVVQRCHSGFQASTARISMNVANASLSQMPFHQVIVDEVAEPHVRVLVRDHVGDPLELGMGGRALRRPAAPSRGR